MMKLGIRGLKTWRTHDGGGYQGTLLLDGTPAATFHNDGNGGCLEWQILDAPLMCRWALEEGIIEGVIAGQPVPCDTVLDTLLAGAVDDYEHAQRLTRLSRTKTLFRLPDDEKGSWRTINKRGPDVEAHILQKYPAATIYQSH